jgi:uncharacterized membrane protein YeaQ/YmgE (transglycosylase-associated protein family)
LQAGSPPRLPTRREGLLRNPIVGLIGSLFGGFVFSKLGVRVVPDFWAELITATIGAVVFLALWQAIRRA